MDCLKSKILRQSILFHALIIEYVSDNRHLFLYLYSPIKFLAAILLLIIITPSLCLSYSVTGNVVYEYNKPIIYVIKSVDHEDSQIHNTVNNKGGTF